MRIGVIGGGRWARVLVSVLCEISPKSEFIWLTKFNFEKANTFLKERALSQVKVVRDDLDFWPSRLDAIINSTATDMHYATNSRALSEGLPVFSEKPFALSLSDADQLITLSDKNHCVFGVDLEVMYASYLDDLKKTLMKLKLSSIEIFWRDPEAELRYGEIKQTGDDTPLTHDALPHCWSVLKHLYPESSLQLQSVRIVNSEVVVSGVIENAPVTISMSRRAPNRDRRVVVNEGETILDFAKEPGSIAHLGQTEELKWHGLKPLAGALTDFLRAVREPEFAKEWRLSAKNCRDSVRISEQATKLLEKSL